MSSYDPRFYPFQRRMREEGIPELFIESFAFYYHQLIAGGTGLISEAEIDTVSDLMHLREVTEQTRQLGVSSLEQAAIIKLNGGLGTSMGLQKAKSLLEVKSGYTFLDVTAEQAVQANVPLILMNSFATDEDSKAALALHEDLIGDVPQTFLQHMEPKVRQSDFAPAEWPEDPELAWCPPGHGDLYLALVTQEVLPRLLSTGYRYAFVSNADNLGATLDVRLLGHMVERRLPFLMEVAERTESDRKGGHLARKTASGRMLLRELAQCPPDEQDLFQDISRHRYFNTNNLWIDLQALDSVLKKQNYMLRLPMIRNSKTLDPTERSSTPVYQLETAVGSAIEIFDGAGAIVVPRSRFAPVKKTNDLLVVRSDAYVLNDDFTMELHPARQGQAPVVDLDPRYFQFLEDFDERFADSVPSMVHCEKLTVVGDFAFGSDVTLEDNVLLINESDTQCRVPDGEVITGGVRKA